MGNISVAELFYCNFCKCYRERLALCSKSDTFVTMKSNESYIIERHPLEPFLPSSAHMLMLGSFPPSKKRWSMEFFYPNWINDMWRIVGRVFFDNPHHFEVVGEKRFDKERVVEFCTQRGIALYDTASAVRRLRDNASDKYLEVVEPTDIEALLESMPCCVAIVTTGQKATEVVAERFGAAIPLIGSFVEIVVGSRKVRFWRMPSSSRAYPLGLERKADYYRTMFQREGMV